ncbi:hypothetical protein BRCON_0347 [Candidatus Sumerlaea chitinivorans]|uniref:Uncharacterized protein n=1 Tax=Sumerlaea chitinivorans TaxID=2250252 RepID=A0A2Z4Y260_SUMC1|nr:hypothetical protein BRCON_0347 [Candidatus Sumerlaea chitinivorans]
MRTRCCPRKIRVSRHFSLRSGGGILWHSCFWRFITHFAL